MFIRLLCKGVHRNESEESPPSHLRARGSGYSLGEETGTGGWGKGGGGGGEKRRPAPLTSTVAATSCEGGHRGAAAPVRACLRLTGFHAVHRTGSWDAEEHVQFPLCSPYCPKNETSSPTPTPLCGHAIVAKEAQKRSLRARRKLGSPGAKSVNTGEACGRNR